MFALALQLFEKEENMPKRNPESSVTDEEIKSQLSEKPTKEWVTGLLDPCHGVWVDSYAVVRFKEREIYLVPQFEQKAACVTTQQKENEKSRIDTRKVLAEFLSMLSWTHNIPLPVKGWTGGTNFNPMRELSVHVLTRATDLDVGLIFEPTTPKLSLALALYREGKSAPSPFYAFLSFYKIINIIEDKGAEQKKLINKKIARVENGIAQINYKGSHPILGAYTRLKCLKKEGVTNFGEYLYGRGRCAIAHAFGDPLVNPDNLSDEGRIREDVVLIEALSDMVIDGLINSQKTK